MPSIRKLFRYLLALVLITTLIIGSFIQPRSYLSKHSSGTLLDSLNPLGAYQEELVLSWKGRLPLVPGTENLTVAENGFDAALLSPPLGNNSLTETMAEFKDPTCQCRKLEIPDDVLKSRAEINPMCGLYSLARGPGQRVLSFSIYGPLKGGYFNGIVWNLKLAREIYPEYVMRLYHDRTAENSEEDIRKLCSIFCDYPQLDLCDSRDMDQFEDMSQSFGMVWRFAPMADSLVSEWHSRDLDSKLNLRERAAVDEWLGTNHTYHVMRDNKHHGTSILGGMFGMRLSEHNRALMNQMFQNLLNSSLGKHGKGLDQSLLRQHLWGIFSKDMISHDSFLCTSYKTPFHRPFPTQRINGPNFTDTEEWNFVGSNGGKIHLHNHGPCPAACRPKEHQDWLMC